ncbi:WbqC family protein [Plebeiibacterium marinum]|uniref:WbqC family protein n=1 Tax=Plebeiibacterium marinum TaxID=2992111 RepID=A0AAE3MB45_9BACT|nr:WbqC family protein [Plebeiobacterium marinum]MCW3804196.1 WbqC family protein [Plebeiobacterium marinum]
MKHIKALFSINYLPSVQYLSHWVNSERPIIEQHDNYIKQTYRNRCDILAANGVIPLTIPVAKGRRPKVSMRDIEISYDTRWQSLHWRSIVSAYNSSPFFEYYMDAFQPFYEKKYRFLFDYNVELMMAVLDALELETKLVFSEDFVVDPIGQMADLRQVIHPKKDYNELDPDFSPKEYRQVFQDRFEFTPNLSVIDLIFNKGPEAIDWLEDGLNGVVGC